MPRNRAMPWATWTTKSPSFRSRKLSMARDSIAPARLARGRLHARRQQVLVEESRDCRAPRRPASTSRKPARTWPVTSCSRSDSASLPAVSTSVSRWHSASFWQAISTRCGRRGDRVEFVAHAVDVAAEPLDRLDPQVRRRLDARAAAAPRRSRSGAAAGCANAPSAGTARSGRRRARRSACPAP